MDLILSVIDWIVSFEDTSSALASLLRLLAPVAGGFAFWWRRPQLDFNLGKTDQEDEALLFITNVGGRRAKDVKVSWFRQSEMSMEPIPQPTFVQPTQSISTTLTIEPISLLAHGAGLNRWDPSLEDPLGWIEVTHRGLVRRIRSGRSIVYVNNGTQKQIAHSLGLSKLPRRSLKEAFPLAGWLDRRLGFADRRNEKLVEERAKADTIRLQNAKNFLLENGVEIGDQNRDSTKEQILFGELGSRGWRWDFSPEDGGYRTIARKRWYPSTSMSIHMVADTVSDSATLALASAIREDEERGVSVKPKPLELDPLSFPPTDPRHDMDWY